MATLSKCMTDLRSPILVVLFIVMSAITVNAQQSNHMKNSKTTGYAPVNGLKMYYEIYGEGNTPLVLIHGGGSTIETTFGTMLPFLSGCGKLIAVELQAHGRTADRDAPESFEQDADDVAALLKYLKIEKASIFGFSNGGTTAMQIAIRHPELVNKIINLSGAYRRDGFIDGFFEGFKGATLDSMPEGLKTAFLNVTPDKNRLQVMFERDVARMVNFKDIPDDMIRSIKVPALIMVSDQDVVPSEHAVKLSRLIPGGRLAVLPGHHGTCIGEMGMVKKGSKLPEMTAAIIEEFLAD
jgi:pimeloyl-ACP methyl ester carboxylesterase